MGRVLVTGAAGFIGSHLVDRLLELGHEVVGVDAFTPYYSRERKLRNLTRAETEDGFRLIEGGLLGLELETLLRGMDGVVHMAAEPGVRASWGDDFVVYLVRNVETTRRLLDAVAEQDPLHRARFVFASSSSVYGTAGDGPVGEDAPRRPASPYGVSKLAAEEMVRLYARERGVPATVLRYFTIYGPRQRPDMALARFVSLASRGEAVEVYGDGEQVREMTHVSDAVGATVAALEAPPGGTYNVGGGSRATVNELAEAVERALGTRIEVRHAPAARGDVRSTWADSSRATRELGFRPQVGLKQGITDQVRWTLGEESVRGPG